MEGLVRKYRVKKVRMRYAKIPLLPGELMEIDVKYVPETIQMIFSDRSSGDFRAVSGR